MKKVELSKALPAVLLLIVSVAAVFYLTGRPPAPESAIRVSYAGKTAEVSLSDLEFVPVRGTVRNGKGEEIAVDGQGTALSAVLNAAGVGEYASVTVLAGDAYSARLTAAEAADPEKAWLLREEDGLRLVVFGDENSRRWVSNVVELKVE